MTLRLGREATLHFASQVGVTLAGFVASFVIARVSGADVFGLYSVAVAVMFWLNVPTTAISTAMTKRLSEGIDRPTFLATGLLLEGGLAVVLGLGVATASPLLQGYVTAPTGPLLGLLVAANVGLVAVVGALQGEKKVAASGGLKTVERVVRSALHVGLVLLGYGASALVGGHVLSLLVAAAIGASLLDLDVGRPSMAAARSLVEYARFSWLGKLKTRAFGWMDTIVLAAFAVGPGLIGVYEIAWNVASIFALLATSVRSTLFPELSELAADDGYGQVHHLLNEGMVFTGLFLIPGLFGAAVVGRGVLAIYGTEFTRGATILVVLVFARLLAAYGNQLLNVANAVDRPDVAFRVNSVFVTANLAFNVAFVSAFGWRGAAAATALSGSLVLILGYRSLRGIIGRPNVPWAELGKQAGAATLMALTVAALQTVLPRSHYVTVLLVGVGAAVYALALVSVSERVRTKAVALVPADAAPSAFGK
ncbi:polysaccharide biosynthesis C-terminal domain-containing protein [Halomicrobium salinisoli]|uniref:oligosaccharide flippase family protein n=1 Tax=Halomicrobium salinisoli TaxID=2878391 RepID=UPI001CEFB921|nr:polysaccharide biosynthesis C-terminal domain-containing protein [Halomicrobium salinisoli]